MERKEYNSPEIKAAYFEIQDTITDPSGGGGTPLPDDEWEDEK